MISTQDWLSRRIRPNPSPYELSQSERYARYRELGVVYEIQPFSDPEREAEYQRHAPERARVRVAGMMALRPCICGSGKESWAAKDARGIFLTFVCDECVGTRLRSFRPDVLNDPDYWTHELVDDDYSYEWDSHD